MVWSNSAIFDRQRCFNMFSFLKKQGPFGTQQWKSSMVVLPLSIPTMTYMPTESFQEAPIVSSWLWLELGKVRSSSILVKAYIYTVLPQPPAPITCHSSLNKHSIVSPTFNPHVISQQPAQSLTGSITSFTTWLRPEKRRSPGDLQISFFFSNHDGPFAMSSISTICYYMDIWYLYFEWSEMENPAKHTMCGWYGF